MNRNLQWGSELPFEGMYLRLTCQAHHYSSSPYQLQSKDQTLIMAAIDLALGDSRVYNSPSGTWNIAVSWSDQEVTVECKCKPPAADCDPIVRARYWKSLSEDMTAISMSFRDTFREMDLM